MPVVGRTHADPHRIHPVAQDSILPKIQLTKSYRLLRFLNRPLGPVSRYALAAAGWVGAMVFTGQPPLAREIWHRIAYKRDVKLAMRRLSWYATYSWMKLNVIKDPVFDFAQDMGAKERDAVTAFLDRKPHSETTKNLDQLTLIAGAVETPMPATDWTRLFERFADHTDALLADLAQTPARPVAKDKSRSGDFATADAARALADFARLFPSGQIPWYVVSGTFLGLIREGGFLAHDYDIDLGIHAEDADLPALIAKLEADDSFIVHKGDMQTVLQRTPTGDMDALSCPILFKIIHCTGVHIDLFVHYLDGTQRWHGSNVHRWDNNSFVLVPYTLAGTPVLGPEDADTYLCENYGDWRTPRTSFNPSTGTPNLRMVHNLASFVLFLRRYALMCENGDVGAPHLAQILLTDGYLQRKAGGLRINRSRF